MTRAGVDLATYRAPPPTVVHIGPGVFHRAHQAVYADTVLRSGSSTGAIRAVSLRSSRLRDALAGQGYRYCVVERDGAGPVRADRVRQIGSIAEVVVAAGDTEAALAGLTDPAVTVVTITVTEHGYCAIAPGGSLDPTRPEVRHDLRIPHAPRSLPGLLVEALHPAPGRRDRAAHGGLVRQPAVQRGLDQAGGVRPGRAPRRRARGVDPHRGRVPRLDGRPDGPRNDR